LAARSKMWAYDRSLPGKLGSNTAGSMDVCREFCVLSEISVTGWSLVQRSPTERDVPECDRRVSIIRRPRSTVGTCFMKKETHSVHDIMTVFPNRTQSRQLHTFTIYVSKISLNILFQYMLPHHKPFLLPLGNLSVPPFIIGFWNRSFTTGNGSDNWKETRHYEFTLRRMSAAVAKFPFAQSTWDQPTSVWLFTHFTACISPFLLFLVMSRGTDPSGWLEHPRAGYFLLSGGQFFPRTCVELCTQSKRQMFYKCYINTENYF